MMRNRNAVRVTVYLPDELRKRAADAGLNLSGLLRSAVDRELSGDLDEARPVSGATVRSRAVPGGTELIVFVPAATRNKRRV